jgi:hypothetical protein
MAAAHDEEAACIALVTSGRAHVRASGIGDGRGLFAAAAVQPGEDVFQEQPFVASPAHFGQWECVCHACLARETDELPLRRCARCRWAHWCSAACEAAGAAAHTPAECAAMAAMRYSKLDLPGTVVLAARMLRAAQQPAAAHEPLRRAQAALAATLVGASDAVPALTSAEFTAWAPTVAALAADEAAATASQPAREAAAMAALCALLRNEFRVIDARDVATGVALYPAVARINHACAPNVRARVADCGWALRIVALAPLAPGDELRLSYVDAEEPAAERAAHLRARFLFDCACGAPECASAVAGE